MPKAWLYIFAVLLPPLFAFLVLHTPFVDWLWNSGHEQAYDTLNRLRVQPQFLEFVGGWPLPVFSLTILAYWSAEDSESIPGQFLMLPFAFVPFTILGDLLLTQEFHVANLYMHPLVILPAGYLYILTWAAFLHVMEKLRLVL